MPENPEVEQFDLDLDALQPAAKTVKLGGKTYEVHPPKFKNLLRLAKLSNKMETGTASEADVDEISKCLFGVMPQLEEDGVDLDLNQFGMLIGFIMSMAQPADAKKLKQMGVEVSQEAGGEKK